MAEIYKLPNGKWFARVEWREGKVRHSKSHRTFRTKREATIWHTKLKNELNKGIKVDKEAVFADFYDKWVERYKAPVVSDITLKRYQIISKELYIYFGQRKIKTISIDDYQDFINHYGANHAPESVHKLNAIVRACVRFAIYDDYLLKDFTQNVTLTANKARVVKVEYLNLKEIHELVTAIKSSLPGKGRFTSKYMILLAIYSGMRLSEIQALTWNDIDNKKATISITKSWDANNHTFKPTKNQSSRRVIPINRSILDIVLQLRKGSTSNLVFLNQYGTIPTSNAVNKTLRSLLDELNIHRRNFHFHSLRHSHVAILLAHNISIYAISKRLGHASTATTSKTYAYLIDEYRQTTDQRIIKALNTL
jgi:integrase